METCVECGALGRERVVKYRFLEARGVGTAIVGGWQG